MKTLFIMLLSLGLFSALQAQSPGASKNPPETMDIPPVVTNQFKKDFPSFTPTWSKEGYNYRADYTDPKDGTLGMIVYDKNAKIVRSETELQANSYPGSINDYHTSNLPSKKFKVYATKDTSGTTSFYSTSDGQTYYFDKNGHFKGRMNPATTFTVQDATTK
jgi:hypothetical protein